MDRWIGAYSIGLTTPGKLGYPIKKKERCEKKMTCPWTNFH
jgi:hypothetical protein